MNIRGKVAQKILLIAIIVIVMGGIGFAIWQAVKGTGMEKQPETAGAKETKTYVVIPALGIRVPYDSKVDVYTSRMNSISSTRILSKKTAEACQNDGTIGILSRYVAKEKMPVGAAGEGTTYEEYYTNLRYPYVIKGEYLYLLVSPQNACADTSTDEGKKAADVQEAAYKDFQENFRRLETGSSE